MEDWVTIISLTYPNEAYMVQAYLESQGIRTTLKDEFTVQVNNFYSNAIGGVKVMVKEDDFNDAMKLLQEGGYLNPEEKSEAEVEIINTTTNKSQCPFCHSGNIGKKRDPNILMLVLALLLGIIFPLFRKTYVCFDCNKEWKYVKNK